MADLSFKQELSEIHRRLRMLEATVRTIFAVQTQMLAEMRGTDPRDTHIDWCQVRDDLLASDIDLLDVLDFVPDPSSPSRSQRDR